MIDAVTKLMALADRYALQEKFDFQNKLTGTPTEGARSHRQALEAELEKVCADAAAYHTLRAELDKQMEAKT